MLTHRQALQGNDLQEQNAVEMKWITSKEIPIVPKKIKEERTHCFLSIGANGITRLLPTPHQLLAPVRQFLLLSLLCVLLLLF